jgi:hypothetical protein
MAVAALLSLTLLAPAASATVATPAGGMFSITPARRYIVARPPVQLAATRVGNSTQSALQVQAVPVLLTQLPSGAFTFTVSPQELRAAGRQLSAQPASFRLSPGSSREVGLRWRGLPRDARTADIGVIYQAVPVASSGPVQVIERLLSVNILRLPGRYRRTGRLLAVHATQARPGVLRFALQADNTGQAVTGPSRLGLSIDDAAGERVLYRRLTPDIVLPGATREFTLDLSHRLPAGSYTAIGQMSFGSSHRLSSRASFRLVAPNDLPASDLRIGPISAQGTVGGAAQITANLRNVGTASGATTISLELYRLERGLPGQRPLAAHDLTTASLAPGRSWHLREGLGHLRGGTYRLLASYDDAGGTRQTLVADFQAREPLGVLAQLRGFSREHALLIPGLLMLLCLASVALLIVREQQSKAALEAARQEIIELQ